MQASGGSLALLADAAHMLTDVGGLTLALIAIRSAAIARDRGMVGPIEDASAFLFKHPPVQFEDAEGYARLLAFAGETEA